MECFEQHYSEMRREHVGTGHSAATGTNKPPIREKPPIARPRTRDTPAKFDRRGRCCQSKANQKAQRGGAAMRESEGDARDAIGCIGRPAPFETRPAGAPQGEARPGLASS